VTIKVALVLLFYDDSLAELYNRKIDSMCTIATVARTLWSALTI